ALTFSMRYCTLRFSRLPWQPVVKLQLHSAGAASRLAALLLVQILPVFSLVAPCHPGASPPSVRRWTFTTGCWERDRLTDATVERKGPAFARWRFRRATAWQARRPQGNRL